MRPKSTRLVARSPRCHSKFGDILFFFCFDEKKMSDLAELLLKLSSSSTCKTNVSSNTTSTIRPISRTDITIENVLISPGNMIFENAFDGKSFSQKLKFQNLRAAPVFIRLCGSTSSAICFKPFEKGYWLSSGLKIVRTVTFTYKKEMPITGAHCFIYIDEVEYEYHFVVHLSEALISLDTHSLDFGRIDASCGDTMRKLVITNSGFKGSQFSIDLGRNDLNLIVEPMKGQIPARTSVTVHIEMVGWLEGEFEQEFWIKTTPPQRVLISGVVVPPRIVVKKSISRLRFVLIDFKAIYFGSRSTKLLIIKNSSPSPAMFYVMAEIKGTLMPLKEACEIDENYRNFIIEPEDGRWAAEQGTAIRVTYNPYNKHGRRKYKICFLKVIRVDCHDLDMDISHKKHHHVDTQSICDSSHISNLSNSSFSAISVSQMYIGDDEEGLDIRHSITSEQSILVCLHGESEEAQIYLRPDLIVVTDMVLNQTYDRVLFVQNLSQRLPIKVKFVKIPFIDVIPHEFNLKRNESLEVRVLIRAGKLDTIETWIRFELFAMDFPPEWAHMRKVGVSRVKIQFTTNAMLPKERLKHCCLDNNKEEQGNFNWDKQFEIDRLNPRELWRKNCNKKYYEMYLRRNRLVKRNLNMCKTLKCDYDLTNRKLLLHEVMKLHTSKVLSKENIIDQRMIPLRPREMYNIKIFPKSINLKRMAPFTTTSSYFTIHNKNRFPINVLLLASKSYLTFDDGDRGTVFGGETKKFAFVFTSSVIGKFPARIDIVINTSAVFKITVMVQVMAKCLRLEPSLIEFPDNDSPTRFITVVNGLNSDTSFDWELPNEYFTIEPIEGGVPAGRSITCMITLLPLANVSKLTECILTAESGQKRILQIVYHKRHTHVSFNSYEIDFGVIPFNTTVKKRVCMKNHKNNAVFFSVPDPNPLPGVTVTPTEDCLLAKDIKIFTVTVTMQALVTFTTKVTVIVDEEFDHVITIKGTVDIPLIRLEPDMIVFRKISPFAFDRAVFQITNGSKFDLTINFPFEDFPEFSITTTDKSHLPHRDTIVLAAHETKLLFLHFYPNYASTYTIYLPYIINSLIGPVSNGSSRISTFLCGIEEEFKRFPDVKVLQPKRPLAYIRLNCCAVHKIVQFFHREITFRYYGEDHWNNMIEADFEVVNVLNEPVKFCIRLDSLKEPFSLTPNCDHDWEEFPDSYLVRLKENEKFTFTASFDAETVNVGEYCVKLPIFVKGHVDDKLFNNLSLRGNYLVPSIVSSKSVLYFESIIPHLRNKICITLEMSNHLPNCHVNTETDLVEIAIEYERNDSSNCSMPVQIFCVAAAPFSYDNKIIFTCSCDSSCEVIVKGVVDNSMLISNLYAETLKTSPIILDAIAHKEVKLMTVSLSSVSGPTFHSTFINPNTNCYPYFPGDSSNSKYAIYMRRVVNILENWIYCQVFNCASYYRIPESFIYEFHQAPVEMTRKKTFVAPDLPLVQFLAIVINPGIRKCFISSAFDGDCETHEYIFYILQIYIKILNYLRNYAIYIPNIKPKYLFNYEQYVLYQKHRKKTSSMSETKFYLYMKQCWVDLILQIIKVFIINRNPIPQIELSDYWNDNTNAEFGVCSHHEQYHLDWLLQTYEKQKEEFPQTKTKLQNIIFMDENLRNSLILGIVTASFCPYVKFLIDQMFFPPSSADQYFHNACLLIKAWNMLNFSFKILPNDIIEMNYMQTILLVTYLHEVLPNCTPTECLTIEAPLSLSGHASLELENSGNAMITYQTIFFQNEQNLFSIRETTISIPPGKKKLITVNYKAKYVSGLSSFLLFSGETPGHKYGKSMCVELKGIPDLTAGLVSDTSITLELYKNCLISSTIQSPHNCAAKYKLYSFHTADIEHPTDKHLSPASKVYTSQLINETAALDPDPTCGEDGSRPFQVKTCCLQPNPRAFYIFYLNEKLGDFGFRCVVTGKLTQKHSEEIDVFIPKYYANNVCICKGQPDVTKSCPMILHVHISAKNELLWNAIKSIILRDVDGPEKQFWNKIIYTPLGTRVIILILRSQVSPFVTIKIDEPVEYDVIAEKNGPIKTLNKLVIKDVIAECSIPIPIHPTKELTNGTLTFLRLNSVDGCEKRLYKLIFKQIVSSNYKL